MEPAANSPSHGFTSAFAKTWHDAACGILGLLLYALAAASQANEPIDCQFPDVDLPADFAVLAGGGYSGRTLDVQIDQSGHQATQMDVVVNYPAKPVVLILGAYEPTIWSLQWSRRTRILAVLVGGYHRQLVAGLPRSMPLHVRTYEDRSPCDYFYVHSNQLTELNPLSRNVFGRAIDMIYLAKNGSIVVGDPIPRGQRLESSTDTSAQSFVDPNAPLAGPTGLRDAVTKGLLRPANSDDADNWVDAVAAGRPPADEPPVAGQTGPHVSRPSLFNAYVVLRPFTFPAGLYGGNLANFFVPRGVPRPLGDAGHSAIYDFNTLTCQGPTCGIGSSSAVHGTPSRGPVAIGATDKCFSSHTDSYCLASEIRRTDDEINGAYQIIMTALDTSGRSNLRSQQRAWLKARDKTCLLSSPPSERQVWIAYVLADNARAVCVLRLTRERLTQLTALQTTLRSASHHGKPPAIEATFQPQRANRDYTATSHDGHRDGKWYFEVTVDHGKVWSNLEATLFIGVGKDEPSVGTLYHLRPQNLVLNMGKGESITIVGGRTIEGGAVGGVVELPKVTIGVAIDLDDGKLYTRRDGEWHDGVPGSAQGTDLKLGREYRAGIQSSAPLQDLIHDGIVTANFGGRPFANMPPGGYAPFDFASTIRHDGLAGTATDPYLPPARAVAGQSTEYWIRKYWEWSRSFQANASPSSDSSGARCTAHQSAPVWFLTGSIATAPIDRRCEIPAGVHILVPILITLAQPPPGVTGSCDQLLQTLNAFDSRVADLRLIVDGVALQNPASHAAGSGCFELTDVAQGVTRLAAGSGYWVFLKPLSSGRHEIAFGGKFIGDGFTQDVRYVIDTK